MCMKQMRNKVSVIRIYERVKYWFSFFYSDKKRKIYVVTNFGCWWQFNLFSRDRNQICQNYLWGRHSNMPKPFRIFTQISFQICYDCLEYFHKEKDKKLRFKTENSFQICQNCFQYFHKEKGGKCGSKQKIPRRIRIHCLTELQLNLEKYDLVGKTRKIV